MPARHRRRKPPVGRLAMILAAGLIILTGASGMVAAAKPREDVVAAHGHGRGHSTPPRAPHTTTAPTTTSTTASPAPTTTRPPTTSSATPPATSSAATTTTATTTTATTRPTTTSTTPSGPAPPTGPAAGRTLAFVDDFDTLSVGQPGDRWAFTSNSYRYGDHNPDDSKLDWNTPAAMTVTGGVLTITATPRGGGYWNTGLLTTEPRNDMSRGGNGFRLQPGDFYVIRAAMPTGNTGAWPALWTWLPNAPRGGEVDPFEWHSDNPNLLELGNALGGRHLYWSDADLVQPGRFVWIGILAGDASNDFYVGDSPNTLTKVWSDGYGLAGQRPHLIANLSVSDGRWHPAPSGTTPIVYRIDTVRVYR